MFSETLYDGCSAVHRRIGLVFVDIFWKALWLVFTAALLAVFLIWIGSGIGSITWEGADPRTNPAVLISLLRGLWDAFAPQAFWGLAIVVAASAIVWLLLEAYFRSRILDWGLGDRPSLQGLSQGSRSLTCRPFKIFLASGIARASILFATILLLGSLTLIADEGRGGVATVAILTFAALAFVLTVADTLIRTDAVALLATHLLEVAGLVGGLLIFEVCIAASAIVAVLISLLHAATAVEFILTFVLAALVVILLTAIHSYLLLVRFFSIDIMRRNVDV
jgi:hypothetical protein